MKPQYLIYCGLAIILIACSAAGFWLVVRNSPSAAPITSIPKVAPANAEVAKPKETPSTVSPQTVIPIRPPGPDSRRTIAVHFVKEEGSRIKLETLDGLSIALETDNSKYVSTPIITDDAAIQGDCRVIGVPPGNYLLKIQALGISQKITVPAQDQPVVVKLTITFRSAGLLGIRMLSNK